MIVVLIALQSHGVVGFPARGYIILQFYCKEFASSYRLPEKYVCTITRIRWRGVGKTLCHLDKLPVVFSPAQTIFSIPASGLKRHGRRAGLGADGKTRRRHGSARPRAAAGFSVTPRPAQTIFPIPAMPSTRQPSRILDISPSKNRTTAMLRAVVRFFRQSLVRSVCQPSRAETSSPKTPFPVADRDCGAVRSATGERGVRGE